MTPEARDRPSEMGGQDPDSVEFWAFIAEVALFEMEPMDCMYTWSMTCQNMRSRLDWFLCSA